VGTMASAMSILSSEVDVDGYLTKNNGGGDDARLRKGQSASSTNMSDGEQPVGSKNKAHRKDKRK